MVMITISPLNFPIEIHLESQYLTINTHLPSPCSSQFPHEIPMIQNAASAQSRSDTKPVVSQGPKWHPSDPDLSWKILWYLDIAMENPVFPGSFNGTVIYQRRFKPMGNHDDSTDEKNRCS